MEYIHRLPFILGASMAIIIGIISNESGVVQQETYKRMALGMLIFFVLGLFAKNILLKAIEDVEKKREEIAKQSERESEINQIANGEDEISSEASSIDYRTPDLGEDFTPLSVSEVIKSQINN